MIGKYASNKARQANGGARPMSVFQAHVSSVVKVYNGTDSEATLVGTIRAGTLARFSSKFKDQNPIPTPDVAADASIAKPPTEFIVVVDAPQMPTFRAVEHTLKWMKESENRRGALTPVFVWDEETPLSDLLDVYATLHAFGLRPFPQKLKIDIFDRISRAPPTLGMFKAVTQYIPLADSIVTRIITAMVDYGDRNAYFVSDIDAMEGYMYKDGPPGLIERFDAIWQARHRPRRFHGGKFPRTGPPPPYTHPKSVGQGATKPAASNHQSASKSARSSKTKSTTASGNGIGKSISTPPKHTQPGTSSSAKLAPSAPIVIPKPGAADSAIGTTSTSPVPTASTKVPAPAAQLTASRVIDKPMYSEAAKTPPRAALASDASTAKQVPAKNMQVLTTKSVKVNGDPGENNADTVDKAEEKTEAKGESHPGPPQRRRRLRRKVAGAE